MRIWLFFLSTLFFTTLSLAQPYEQLKKEYLSLRNTDIEINDTSRWEDLARRLEKFAKNNPKDSNAALALFNASILYEELFIRFGGEDRFQYSCELLGKIAAQFPSHEIADDSLLRLGDLRLFESGDVKAARESYLKIVQAFADSDMLEVAQARLASIKSGKYKRQRETGSDDQIGKRPDQPLILLDPGHGGEDFGAIGKLALMEKDVVLDVALKLEKILRQDLGAIVRLTRRADDFVPLTERTNLANDFEADLFISLHTNASPKGNVSGFEVYYLDNTEDKSSRKLAERENNASRLENYDDDLRFMLSDLIQNAKLDDSIVLANELSRSLLNVGNQRWGKIRNLGVKKAPFYVLVGAHMPCVLVELLFIDNTQDVKLLSDKDFRLDLAKALAGGIKSFLSRQNQK